MQIVLHLGTIVPFLVVHNVLTVVCDHYRASAILAGLAFTPKMQAMATRYMDTYLLKNWLLSVI